MNRLSFWAWLAVFFVTGYWICTLGIAYHDAMTYYFHQRQAQIENVMK